MEEALRENAMLNVIAAAVPSLLVPFLARRRGAEKFMNKLTEEMKLQLIAANLG